MRTRLAAALISMGVLGLAAPVLADDGDLDTTWGGTGMVGVSQWSSVWASVVRPYSSDRIAVAGFVDSGSGQWDSSFVMRFHEDATLDTTCAAVGYAGYRGPYDFLASDMVVLDDGSMVLTGSDAASPPAGLVVKFTPTCQLDQSFGDSGVFRFTENDGVALTSIDAAPDGSLAVGGLTHVSPVDGGDSRLTVYRLQQDGAFDTAFGPTHTGRFISDATHEGMVTDLLVDTAGRVIATGILLGATEDETVFRLGSDGTVDGTFGTAGWFVWSGVEDERSSSIAMRQDGRIVVVGMDLPSSGSGTTTATVLCLAASGSPDVACGVTGRQTMTALPGGSNRLFDVDVDVEGRVIVSGSADDPAAAFGTHIPIVMRLHADLTPDTSFGAGGVVTIPRPLSHLFSVARDHAGRIVGAGVEYGNTVTGLIVRLAASTTTTLPDTDLAPPTTLVSSTLPATGRGTMRVTIAAMSSLVVGLIAVSTRRRHITYRIDVPA